VPVIDRYIRNNYGDVIPLAGSPSMEMSTVLSLKLGPKLLVSSLTLSQRLIPASEFLTRSQAFPARLYVLNSNGLPLLPSRLTHQMHPSANYRPDSTCYSIRSIHTGARAAEALVGQQEQMSQQLQDSANSPLAGIPSYCWLSHVKSRKRSWKRQLAFTANHEHFNLTGMTWIICSTL
jgi:hypothetical protein